MLVRIVSFFIFAAAAVIFFSDFLSEKEAEPTQFNACMDESIVASRIVDACEAALDQREWPKNEQFMIHLKLARAQLRQDNSNAAIDELNDALELNPNSVEGLVMRAFAADRIDDTEMSQADYASAVALDPSRVSTLMWRAKSNFDRNNFGAALADYERVLHMEPQNQSANTYAVEAIVKLEMYEQALERLDIISEIWPNNANIYELQGTLRYHLGAGFAPTNASFQRLLELKPEHPEVMFLIGATHLKFGDRKLGKEYIEKYAEQATDLHLNNGSQITRFVRKFGDDMVLGGGAQHLSRAIAYSWIGEYDLAHEEFDNFQNKGGQVSAKILRSLVSEYADTENSEDHPLSRHEVGAALQCYMESLDLLFSLDALRRSI